MILLLYAIAEKYVQQDDNVLKRVVHVPCSANVQMRTVEMNEEWLKNLNNVIIIKCWIVNLC